MNIVVPVHLSISVHNNHIFKRTLQSSFKFLIPFHWLIGLGELVLQGQVMFRLKLLDEVFDVPDHVGQGVVVVGVHWIKIVWLYVNGIIKIHLLDW